MHGWIVKKNQSCELLLHKLSYRFSVVFALTVFTKDTLCSSGNQKQFYHTHRKTIVFLKDYDYYYLSATRGHRFSLYQAAICMNKNMGAN